ncbi:MAG: hypothetical protein R2695_21500 [Acidimicrobiales bacterium]
MVRLRVPTPLGASGGRDIVAGAAVSPLAGIRAVGAALALGDLAAATDAADRGLAALSDGEQGPGQAELAVSTAAFDRARAKVSGPWTLPARLVPVPAQHVRAVQVVTAKARRLPDGRPARPPVRSTSTTPRRERGLDLDLSSRWNRSPRRARRPGAPPYLDRPWLVDPASFSGWTNCRKRSTASPPRSARTAALAVKYCCRCSASTASAEWLVVPYPAGRGTRLGGLLGNWRSSKPTGPVRLVDTGRNRGGQRAAAARPRPRLVGPAAVDVYGGYEPNRFFQTVTLSPDLPMVAEVTANLFDTAMDTRSRRRSSTRT